jgi:hypothetical protein
MIASAALLLAGCSTPPAPSTDSSTAAPPTGPVCNLTIMASFPVTYIDGDPTIPITIGTHQLHMVVDSGSNASYLSPGAYDLLNIHRSFRGDGYVVNGLGGTADIDNFVMEDMHFGSVHLHDVVMGVFPHDVPVSSGHQAEDGVIGYDILELFDVGFDLPHNQITFYRPQNCTVNATPWRGDYAAATYTRPQGDSPQIPITINNATFKMFVDSDSDDTVIKQRSLDRAGIKPEATQAVAGQNFGIAGKPITTEHAQFSNVTIGAETFQDDWLLDDLTPSAELNSAFDGTIGEDYFRTHRVFIANSTHTVYLGLTIQPGS